MRSTVLIPISFLPFSNSERCSLVILTAKYNSATMANEPYQFGSEQDIRNVMKLLVEAIKLWQVAQ